MPYDKSQLTQAVSSVRRGVLTISQAAREYGVPRVTVSDHVKNPALRTTKGPPRQLTQQETDALVNFFVYCANQGFPLPRDMARMYIQEIIRKSGRKTYISLENGPSDAWFRRLKADYPQLAFKTPSAVDQARLKMANEGVINEFFRMWKEVLVSHNMLDKPAQLYNCDETGWSGKEVSKTKVIALKTGMVKQQRVMCSDHVTAHLCVNADGAFLPPMVIFKGGMPHQTFRDGIPGSWTFASSESGYMDSGLFVTWFEKCFLPNCGTARPVILLLDNHDSHVTLAVIERARTNNIIMVCMPSHTTHIVQPLDVKINGPLKAKMQTIATRVGFLRQGTTIGKAHMPALLAHAMDQTTRHSVKEAFRLSGIMPVNADAIDRSHLVPSSFIHTTEDKDDEPPRTCETCGQYVGQNPLVKRGLVPEFLANILVPPPVKPYKKKSKKVVPKGRVITGDEMVALLKEKEEMARKQEEEAEIRRQNREANKKKKEHEKEELRKRKLEREEKKEKKRVEMEGKRRKKQTKKQDSVVEPAMGDSVVEPAMGDSVVEPAMGDNVVEPAMGDSMAEPAMGDSVVEPAMGDSMVEPAMGDSVVEPAMGDSVVEAELIASFYVCGVCGVCGTVADDVSGVMWLGCDEEMCGLWFHERCLCRAEREFARESLEDGGDWFCSVCKPWLYEEE